MVVHGLCIGLLGEGEAIHVLKVKTNGELWDRKNFLFFLPYCLSVKVLCLVVCFSSFYVWSLFKGHLGNLSNKFFLPGKQISK